MKRIGLLKSRPLVLAANVFLVTAMAVSGSAEPVDSKPRTASGNAKTAEVYTMWPFDAKEAVKRQDETVKTLGISKDVKVDLGGGTTIEFILIPAGKYMMGDGAGREAAIDKPFYMGKFLVTEAQWTRVMGKNPSKHPGAANPVDSVDWAPATEFAAKVSATAKKTVRLPTEAEWEYACRAGTATLCYWGDDMTKMGAYCWWHDNCGGKTNPVGKKLPNSFGLFDMMGNVWEWCSDGGPEAKTHWCRGATFGSKVPMFKSSTHMSIGAGANDRFGLRVVMDVE